MSKLRSDVRVTLADGALQLCDDFTGLLVELDPSAARLIGDGRSQNSEEQELLSSLSAIGFLDEGLTPDEVRDRQRAARRGALEGRRLERLHEGLRFARERVPYYRERAAVYDPARITALEELSALPLMRKADLRANFPAGLLADGIDLQRGLEAGTLELTATSGSTGERLQVVSDMEVNSVPDDYEELWGLPESELPRRTAIFTSPVCMGTECHLGAAPFEKRKRGEHTVFLNSVEDLFSLKRPRIENVAQELEQFRPDLMLVNPVYYHWLLRKAGELGIRLHAPKVVLSSYQYLSRLQRREIQALTGAKIYDFYLASDTAGSRIGVECHRGRLHVREDHALLQTVRASGPAAPGELGAVAVTTWANRVMPLVRYLIGDVAVRLDVECDCVARDWPCFELHGRGKDMLQIRGRWVTTREVDEVVSQAPALDFYRLTQTAPLELQVDAIPALTGSFSPQDLEQRLCEGLGVERVRVKVCTRLDPEVSLKFRATQSLSATLPELP